jgi:hypothetical protein
MTRCDQGDADLDADVEMIKEILPNVKEAQIRKVLAETGDVGSAVKQFLFPGSPVVRRKSNTGRKRVVVSVHNGCGDAALEGVRNAVASIRSAEISVSDRAPQFTISISYQGTACKPMIYVEPRPLDMQFCENIETNSIILSDRYDNMDIKLCTSFNGIILLPFTQETVNQSVHHILVDNGIVGEGPCIKGFSDIWREMLSKIPHIKEAYADSICGTISSPYEVLHSGRSPIVGRSGNRIPSRVLDVLRFFFETDNAEERLDACLQKRRGIDED